MKTNCALRNRLVLATTLCGVALITQNASAKDIWVDANTSVTSGNDGTYGRPFRTITGGTGAWNINPGDTVIVRPGTYRESVWMVSGTPGAPVTYKSEIPRAAKIIGPSNGNIGAFHVAGGNNGTSLDSSDGEPGAWQKSYGGSQVTPRGYINIEGFDITSERIDGNGVWFQWAHHITIKNNKIHDCGGAGIGASLSDYLTIEWNEVNDNSKGTTNGFGSGISLWRTRPWDNNSGFHNIIRNNFVWHNHNNLGAGNRSDGNGIIVDTTLFDKGTLIENNVIWDNGGAGVMLDAAANVTVRFNTLYKNSWDWALQYPEIYLQGVDWEDGDPYTAGEQFSMEDGPCKNVSVYANIISTWKNRFTVQINPGNARIAGSQNCWTNNNLRWYEGTEPSGVPDFYPGDISNQESRGPADVVGDPAFIAASNASSANFRLNSSSPAINKIGWANTTTGRDVAGVQRPQGSSNDMGAYEFVGSVTTRRITTTSKTGS